MAIDGGSVEIRIEGDTSSFRRSVEESVDLLNDVQKAADKVDESLASSGFSGFGKKAKEEFSEFANSATDAFLKATDASEDFVKSLGGIGTSLKNIGLGALTGAATAAGGALVSLAKKGIQATDFLETSRVAMSGLTGSIEEGNKAMSLAANYWQNNPFQRIDVTQATKQLVQFGRTTNDIAGDLDILGNVSLSTGMNIADLARYYARVSSSGRAMTMDLEMMSDRGVPIYRELEKLLHTTTAGVREMASRGKIDFETFRKAMEGAVSAEAMEQYENTMARQVDRLKGSIQIIAGQLAGYKIINDQLVISEQGLEKAWTRLIKTLATNLRSDSMKNAMEKIGDALAKVVDKITTLVEPALNVLAKALEFIGENSELLLPILGGVLVMFGRLGSQIPVVGGLISSLNKNITGLGRGLLTVAKAHPIISGLVALFTIGFKDAMKNSEQFRNTISSLFTSLRDIFNNLMTAFRGIFTAFSGLIKTLADSGVVQGILQGIASALAWIAKALASIPPETLAGIISFFASLKLLKSSPITLVVTSIALLIQYIKELGGLSKFFEKLPETLNTIGHNIMTGLFNGIKEGATKIVQFVKNLAKAIIDTFRNMLGIHSPSTVMYELGQDVGLGLANGIEDSSDAVQVAMNNLANDILKLSEKIIGNKVDFGLLDVKGEYQEWKKVSKLFTQGSEQYNYAIQKMEDTRKQANLKILALQQSYNSELDETIDKISKMYGLFDEVNLGGGKNASTILKNLDQQVAKMQEWAEAQKIISETGLDSGLVEELKSMGVSSVSELSAIANMTADELGKLNDMWLQKQSIANDEGIRQMEGLKNDTLGQINELKKGIDGTTVDVKDVGGRLVESISEGVYGAMPTLQSAFSQLNDYIEKAHKELAKSVSGTGTTDSLTAGDSSIGVPDTATALKEEITASMDKLKNMIPNILLGAVAAWGTMKFGPKILKAIGSKIFGGGTLRQGVSGLLMGGNLNKAGLENLVDMLFAESEEGSASQKIISKIQDKLKGIGKDGALNKAAEEVARTTKPAQTIAKSTQSISASMETTSTGFSKANTWMKSIQEGAKTIIWIAGAIAAVGAALWLAYNALKDVDFVKFQLVLVEMTEAVAVFGALAKVADMLKVGISGILVIAGIAADVAVVALACRVAYELMKGIDFVQYQLVIVEMIEALGVFGGFSALLGIFAPLEAAGLLVIAGVAGDIALVSLACRSAYDNMKGMDFETFGKVIEAMIQALGSFGGFQAILGIFAPLELLGWASVMAVCDSLVKVSEAIVVVDKKVPKDFGDVSTKLDHIKTTLEKINGLDLGTVIGMMVTSWSVDPVLKVMGMYSQVADVLEKLSKLNIDKDKVDTNLDYIKSTLENIKAKTGILAGWLESWAMDAEASTVENAGRIIIVYGQVCDSIDKLGNLSVNQQAVLKGIESIASIVKSVREYSYGSSGIFNIFNNMETVANDVEKIKSIIQNFLEMVPTFKDLEKPENQISNATKTTVEKNIENIKSIVLTIGSVATGGWVEQKEKDVDKIQSILNKFTELVPTANQIAGMAINYETALARIEDVKRIVLAIGSVDTGGWIDQKESDMNKIQSIINKFTEIIPVANQVAGTGFNAEDIVKKIAAVQVIIRTIGAVDTSANGQAQDKEWAVGMAISIARKMLELQGVLGELNNADYSDAVTNMVRTINDLLSDVEGSMASATQNFTNLGVSIVGYIADGLTSNTDRLTAAGLQIQSTIWSAIESKMNDEYQQGAWMATQFGEGLLSVANTFGQVGAAMQTSLWWGIQNRMNDEYYQGKALGERFRQGLYDVDYANAGWWAAQGFINGANNRDVYSAGWQIADRFLQGLRARGQQGSPWKTTIESGNFAVEGLIEGLRQSEDALVGEATSLADQVISTLTMDDLSLSPELNPTMGGVAPSVLDGEYDTMVGGRGVVVNQQNNVYTDLDMDTVNRNLAWDLARI